MRCTSEDIRKAMDDVKKEWFEEWNSTDTKPSWNYEQKQEEIYTEWLQSLEVGDHAHICHYSDITPCTVVEKTATTITVRNDKAEKSANWNPQFVSGGFSAHCINNDDQSDWWVCQEDTKGTIEIFRWKKKNRRWMNSCGERLYPEWQKKYDYNF